MKVTAARVLVTGGASGLGNGVVRRLAGGGARVGILDLPSSRGAEAAAAVDGVFAGADVRNPAEVEAGVAHIAETLGGLDVCVNAAGVANAHRVMKRSGELFPLDLFEFVIGVNLVGTFDGNTCRLFQDGKLVAEQGGAAIRTVWPGPLHVGQYSGDPSAPFQVLGQVAGVKIYNRALPAEDAAAGAKSKP